MSEGIVADRLASPCVGTCQLDPGTGWCLGCARSGDEIAAWGGWGEAERQAVWDALPERKAELGLGFRLWPGGGGAVGRRLAALASQGTGVWTMGVYGAVGEFSVDPGEPVSVETGENGFCLQTGRGSLSVRLPEKIRLFELVGGGRVVRLVAALHQAHCKGDRPAVVTECGPDTDALGAEDRDAILFDLGLERAAVRFCIRTAAPALLSALRSVCGQPWETALPALMGPLLAENPHRVLTNRLGRMEIYQPIGGSAQSPETPEGPHTHLLPSLLRFGRDLEPRYEIPSSYVPCLSHYPA